MNYLFEKIKDLYNSLKQKFLCFYEENKRLTYLILALVLAVLLCIIILLAGSGKKNKKTVPGQKLELTEKLVVPDGPVMPREQTISRKTKDKWSEEEAEPWFTVPSDREIDSLGKANDSLVNEIIGAAP